MVTLALTDQEVFDLALKLPVDRRYELAQLLNSFTGESPIVYKNGLHVFSGEPVGDIAGALDLMREERLNSIMGIIP